jgi:hypothetical protein
MATGELLWIVAVHLVLTGLPGVAAALLAARRGVSTVPVLLAIALAATGVVAMLAFWSYYADPVLGETFSFFVVFGSAAASAWILFRRLVDPGLLRRLATPLALWALGSVFLVFLGFVHGGTAQPLGTAATRFSVGLPSDNAIPFFFAEWFAHHGHHGTVPVFPGEWLVSDRPPLQIGYVLSQRPFGWDKPELDYQVIGVLLQQLWIVGLWALLVAARVGRLTRALVVLTVLLSDVAILNGFFVWPKMLPAAMLLAAAALVVTPLWGELRRRLWAAALIAALVGLAMLGHGSSVFGVIPLALIAAYRGLPSWRWIGVAVLVGIAFMAPWSAFQKYDSPPGNRLTKYMLAGVPEVDPRSTSEAIFDSYGEAGLGGAIHYKAENFVTMLGGGPMAEALKRGFNGLKAGDLSLAIEEVRVVLFFCLLPSLGLLLLGPVAMALARGRGRRRPGDWSFALTCFFIVGVGAFAWGLLLFGNLAARAVLHAGSFMLPVLGLAGAVAGLRAVFPRFAIYYVAFSAALSLAIYAPALEPPPGTSYSLFAILVAAASLAGFGFLAVRGAEAPQEVGVDGERAELPTPAIT